MGIGGHWWWAGARAFVSKFGWWSPVANWVPVVVAAGRLGAHLARPRSGCWFGGRPVGGAGARVLRAGPNGRQKEGAREHQVVVLKYRSQATTKRCGKLARSPNTNWSRKPAAGFLWRGPLAWRQHVRRS